MFYNDVSLTLQKIQSNPYSIPSYYQRQKWSNPKYSYPATVISQSPLLTQLPKSSQLNEMNTTKEKKVKKNDSTNSNVPTTPNKTTHRRTSMMAAIQSPSIIFNDL